MKTLILAISVIASTYTFACSCAESTFTTPRSYKMTERLIERVFNSKVGEIDLVKYYPNAFERVFAPRNVEDRTGSNCWGNGPRNEPIDICRANTNELWSVQIKDLNCKATVKVKRTKRKSTAKLISHNCVL